MWIKSTKELGFPCNPRRWLKRRLRRTWKRIDKRKRNKYLENTISHNQKPLRLNDHTFKLNLIVTLRKTFLILVEPSRISIGKYWQTYGWKHALRCFLWVWLLHLILILNWLILVCEYGFILCVRVGKYCFELELAWVSSIASTRSLSIVSHNLNIWVYNWYFNE